MRAFLPSSCPFVSSFLRVASVALLIAAATGCSQVRQLATGARDSATRLSDFLSRAPRNAAVQMESASADERRTGINRLVARDFGRKAPYTERYKQLVQLDDDWLVRATAVRALNRSRDGSATPVFVKASTDANDRVRLEGVKALTNVPDDNGVASLLAIVGDEAADRDLRIAAADALRHYKTLDVSRKLVNVLGEREFAVAWQARQSLVRITGVDYEYNEAAWLAHLTGG